MKKILKKAWLTAVSSIGALGANAITVFAEDAAQATDGAQNGGQAGGMLYPIIMIGLFIVVGYFMIIRPEKKRKKAADDMRDSLKPGDRITTIGGIVGTVETITDEEITLTNGLILKRWALRSIESAKSDEKSSAVTYYDDEEETADEEKSKEENK